MYVQVSPLRSYQKKKIALYVPWFNSDSPLKFVVYHFFIFLFFHQALDPKFDLALKQKVLELEGSSFGIRPYVYVLNGCYEEPHPEKPPYQ